MLETPGHRQRGEEPGILLRGGGDRRAAGQRRSIGQGRGQVLCGGARRGRRHGSHRGVGGGHLRGPGLPHPAQGLELGISRLLDPLGQTRRRGIPAAGLRDHASGGGDERSLPGQSITSGLCRRGRRQGRRGALPQAQPATAQRRGHSRSHREHHGAARQAVARRTGVATGTGPGADPVTGGRLRAVRLGGEGSAASVHRGILPQTAGSMIPTSTTSTMLTMLTASVRALGSGQYGRKNDHGSP